MKNKNQLPDCCSNSKKSSGWRKGLLYGILPHSFCILFILASLVGANILTELLKPLMMNRYFFYGLIGISLIAATLSAIFYLGRNQLLNRTGIKKKWKYLSVMYSLTVGINLLFFLIIFPMFAASVNADSNFPGSAEINLKVKIPCPGHAPLITQELQKVGGVQGVSYSFPNNFKVSYDPEEITIEQILN